MPASGNRRKCTRMSEINRRDAFKIAVAGGLAATTIIAGSAEEALAQAASQGATPTFRLLLVNDIYKMNEVAKKAALPASRPLRGPRRLAPCRVSMPMPATCIRLR